MGKKLDLSQSKTTDGGGGFQHVFGRKLEEAVETLLKRHYGGGGS
jgi:hypothetical protein